MNYKKIIQAYKNSKDIDILAEIKFNSATVGSTICVVFRDVAVLECASMTEAKKLSDDLNNAISPVLSDFKSKLEQKIEAIINA